MQIDLLPDNYRVIKGKRREPFFGLGWPILIIYFVMFWLLFGLAYVPQGSWLSPIARAIAGQFM